VIYCSRFAGAEDRATLRSDPSASPDLREGGEEGLVAFSCAAARLPSWKAKR